MDTDGSTNKNRITFHTTSFILAKDVAEIVRSLRGEAIIRKYNRTKESKPIEFQINIKLNTFCPFSKESSKANSLKSVENRHKYGRYINSITFEKTEEAICISVEAKDGLYITDDYIVTHNTAQALAYIVHQKISRTLVICPASVKYAWESEVKKWTKLKPFVLSSDFFRSNEATLDVIKQHDIFIINYDILKRFIDSYGDVRWDCLVVDEFHYIKSGTAIRTKFVKSIGKRISHILLLSGTPLLSRPAELLTGLQMMDPIIWKDWRSYTERYCDGHQGYWGWDARGSSNIDELKQKISRYFLRRRKEEVLPDLPPKQYIDIPVEMDNESRFEYDLAMSSFVDYLQKVKGKRDKDIAKSMQAMKLVRLGELRQITTKSKINAAQEIIQNIIDSGEKVVVFSNYNEPLQKLHEKFKNESVLILGSTPGSSRKELIDVFQTKPEVKVFFGGIKSTGVGITLTAASNVLFLDYSWVPADHHQAADRTHRIGQTAESINIYQMYARKSIDEKMKSLLASKQALFDKLIEDIPTSEESVSIVDALIKEIQKEKL